MEAVRRANQSDWTNWAKKFEWNVTGTLNFIPNRKPSIDVARRNWRSFWNMADRIVYGKMYNQIARIPRFACIHLGANGDNPHLQFVALSPIEPEPFCIALNAIWSSFELAAPPSQNCITPTISQIRSIAYSGHEHQFQGVDTYALELMHLPSDVARPSPMAVARLAAAKPMWHGRAKLAYPIHVEKALVDYNKRTH
jgi:hypothetical protein